MYGADFCVSAVMAKLLNFYFIVEVKCSAKTYYMGCKATDFHFLLQTFQPCLWRPYSVAKDLKRTDKMSVNYFAFATELWCTDVVVQVAKESGY